MKKVLVVGGGGREHAIVDALSRSPQVDKIYCAPGNAGIAEQAECVAIKDTDIIALKDFAKANNIDLTVVGPEVSLAKGIVDLFRQEGLAICGHTQSATQIESSKEFAKQIMKKYNVPTADYQSFDDYEKALDFVKKGTFPAVLKYDGLAAGKGVIIAENLAEADEALKSMLLDESFGKGRVVIEEFLQGPEFSFMCFVSDTNIIPMPLAQDHKRAFDGDKGPNTGGMGAYTALPFITEEDIRFAEENILKTTVNAMAAEGFPLSGVLYAGLMKTQNGIKVIEFNARFGDPETEVVLPLLSSDIFDIFMAAAKNQPFASANWKKDVTMGVVMASNGYPASYQKGFIINGLDTVDCKVFHMGTAAKEGNILTNGGRVLMVVATASDIRKAQAIAYENVKKIKCENLFYRKDIAHQAL